MVTWYSGVSPKIGYLVFRSKSKDWLPGIQQYVQRLVTWYSGVGTKICYLVFRSKYKDWLPDIQE